MWQEEHTHTLWLGEVKTSGNRFFYFFETYACDTNSSSSSSGGGDGGVAGVAVALESLATALLYSGDGCKSQHQAASMIRNLESNPLTL